MKVINFILALLFLVFAFVQVNDPDPLLWILIYGNMAVQCVLAMFRMQYKIWIIISGVFYLVYAAILLPGAMEWFHSPDKALLFDDLAKMQNLYIEETREFLGLMICVIVLVYHYMIARKITQ